MTAVAVASDLDEFARIARFFAPLAAPGALGLLDDVALLDGPGGDQYVLTADAIVEGVHFLPDDPPFQIAQKLLRVNLSDLAAKGARPVGYLLTTSLPRRCGSQWLADFAAGLASDQASYGIGLLGGDSVASEGPPTLGATAIGRVRRDRAPLRSGAREGDLVFVSGTLGDAALGLQMLEGALGKLGDIERGFLADRYRLPQPRLALGQRLVDVVNAMMDVSDGLIGDLGHICRASGTAAEIDAARLPLSAAASAAIALDSRHFFRVLGGGDDYELLFTAPQESLPKLEEIARAGGVPVTPIGRITAGQGVRVFDEKGAEMTIEVAGYRHF